MEQLAAGEGTGGTMGYDTTFGHGQFDPPGFRPIRQMSLDEVDRFQAELAARSKPKSSAIGRYQVNRQTRGELQEAMGLSGTERFTPELQDHMARERLKRAG
jgi:muramidase (phage lysozyme)